jgi:pimeloyl-ACP methyl ester carboxylesterase
VRVSVGDVRLFVETVGTKLEHGPDGARERPTIVALHGGPGYDHTLTRRALDPLQDIAQLVHYDMRGHGRSDEGPPARWTLETWADDVVRLCEALGIERPVVVGKSFGAFVGALYAARHPDHPGRLVLVSAAARHLPERCVAVFERLGGPEAAETARAALSPEASTEDLERYDRVCMPLYSARPSGPSVPAVSRPELRRAFVSGEAQTMDLRASLAKVRCPVLVVTGVDDPITTIEDAREVVEHLPATLVRFEPIEDARHNVYTDVPGRALELIREFVLGQV